MTDEEQKDDTKIVRLFESNPNVDRLTERLRKVLDKHAYGKCTFAEAIGVLEILKYELLEAVPGVEDV